MTEGRVGALAAVSQRREHLPAGSIRTYTELPTLALPAVPVLGSPWGIPSILVLLSWAGAGVSLQNYTHSELFLAALLLIPSQ